MFYRKIRETIKDYFADDRGRILIIDGARQVGKSFIIRHVGSTTFENYIELNMLEDSVGSRLFAGVRTTEDFYLRVSSVAGEKLGGRDNTLIFIDEIQTYPELLTLLKFLRQENRFAYIASGSLLGVTLMDATSIPMGSIRVVHMYPMDFEEFLLANGFNAAAIDSIRSDFRALRSQDEAMHGRLTDLFRKYLLAGGMPDAVKAFTEEKNIVSVRAVQSEIREYYGMDASKYDREHKLKIRRIYDMIPSTLENRKKRIVVKDIEDKKGRTFASYRDEFDYLIHSGIALEVKAVSNPVFPLIESSGKNLLKLYLNDVGLLTDVLYRNNVSAVMDDVRSINLGTVYESAVAAELKAHGHELFYYDNRSRGEVDFLIDDYDTLSVAPIEVKSGKDYTVHSALNHFVSNPDYGVNRAYVLSNEREVKMVGKIVYLPVYYVMFL